MIATITGHRCKVFDELEGLGYDITSNNYAPIRKMIREALLFYDVKKLYVGMAQGTDQIAALVALQLKKEGHDIKIHAAVPYEGYSDQWPKEAKKMYDEILKRCDEQTLVSNLPYSAKALDNRNKWMVDRSDMVLAVYDYRAKGGTKNCIVYAVTKDKPVICLPPFTGAPHEIKYKV